MRSVSSPMVPLRKSLDARLSASIPCMARASSKRASGSSSRAWPRTARSRRSGLPMRRALHSASSGMRNTIRSAIRSTANCFRRSARHFWSANARLPEACSRKNKRRSHRKRLLHFQAVTSHGTRARQSQRIVHLEFDRMRRHLEALNFGHLQLDIAVDEVVVEHTPVLEEGAILVEILQRLAERTAHGGNRLELFLRQIVEVLVH